jgi:hypothetical protein
MQALCKREGTDKQKENEKIRRRRRRRPRWKTERNKKRVNKKTWKGRRKKDMIENGREVEVEETRRGTGKRRRRCEEDKEGTYATCCVYVGFTLCTGHEGPLGE